MPCQTRKRSCVKEKVSPDAVLPPSLCQVLIHFSSRFTFSVLLFPPVNNYRRFLIHKLCEGECFKHLSTFSVGQGLGRRTVVCHAKDLLSKPDVAHSPSGLSVTGFRDQESGIMVLERQNVRTENASPNHNCQSNNTKRIRATPAIYRPPAARRLESIDSPSGSKSEAVLQTEKPKTGTRQRRPDIQVYVPRAKRLSMVEQETVESGSSENSPAQRKSSNSVKRNSHEVTSKGLSFRGSHASERELADCITAPAKGEYVGSSREELVCLKDEKKQLLPRTVSSCEAKSVESKVGCSQIVGYQLVDSPLSIAPATRPAVACNQLIICDRPTGTPIIDRPRKVNDKCCAIPAGDESQRDFVSDRSRDCIHKKYTVPEERCSDGNGVESFGTELNYDNFSSYGSCEIENGNSDEDLASSAEVPKLSTATQNNNVSNGGENDCVSVSSVCVEGCGSVEVNHTISCDQSETSDVPLLTPIVKKAVVNDCDESRKQEEQNRKNRRILRGNFVSDVLIISDPEPLPETVPLPLESPPKESLEKCESDVKKKKSPHKPEIAPDTGKDEASTKPRPSLNPDECTWEMMFDDNGDCLDPKIMEELTQSVRYVNIEKPRSNYNRFITRGEMNLPGGDGEFAHVVEIYNFPPEFKTQDLLTVFSPYKNGGFEIRWVDDTHALGVFSSPRVAADVLANDHPLVKTRPLSEATPESRLKARRSAEFLQPYKPRPQTCTALARRLVTGALGMKITTSREEREAERQQLREAREKKRLAAQQQQDAWEGTIRDK